jgi:hypothetical protein
MKRLTINEKLPGLVKIPCEKECTVFRVEGLLDSIAEITGKNYVNLKKLANNDAVDNSSVPFPWKLHAMLDDADYNGFEGVVSWEHDGEAFKVYDPDLFVAMVLPHYFNQTRYKSFQRQLNIYGFTRVATGRDKGLCKHKFFVRGQPSLCSGMQRMKIKESRDQVPESILLSQGEEMMTDSSEVSTDSSDGISQEEDNFESSDTGGTVFDKAFFEGKSFYLMDSEAKEADPTLATPLTVTECSNPRVTKESPTTNCRHDSFPWKLHTMLEQVEKKGDDHIVSWEQDGRALRVHKPKEFVQKILPVYFLHSKKWESFQRQLILYGFTRIARGPKKGLYLHKYFVRDHRSLCRRITRPR